MVQRLVREEQIETFYSRRNAIINGSFDIWQRGTSFPAISIAAYTADRWIWASNPPFLGTHNVDRVAFTPGQTDVPGEPRYYLRYTQTVPGLGVQGMQQRVEGVRTFAGETVTLSAYLKSDVSRPIQMALLQVYDLNNPTTTAVTYSKIVNVTTNWQRYTFTTTLNPLGAFGIVEGFDALVVGFAYDQNIVHIVDLANVQLERGPVATDFEYRPIEEEVALCQRYYEKSYNTNTDPGTIGALNSYMNGTEGTGGWDTTTPYKVNKRISPSVTVYSPNTGTANWMASGLGGDVPVVVVGAGEWSFGVTGPPGPAGVVYAWHFTADAEL